MPLDDSLLRLGSGRIGLELARVVAAPAPPDDTPLPELPNTTPGMIPYDPELQEPPTGVYTPPDVVFPPDTYYPASPTIDTTGGGVSFPGISLGTGVSFTDSRYVPSKCATFNLYCDWPEDGSGLFLVDYRPTVAGIELATTGSFLCYLIGVAQAYLVGASEGHSALYTPLGLIELPGALPHNMVLELTFCSGTLTYRILDAAADESVVAEGHLDGFPEMDPSIPVVLAQEPQTRFYKGRWQGVAVTIFPGGTDPYWVPFSGPEFAAVHGVSDTRTFFEPDSAINEYPIYRKDEYYAFKVTDIIKAADAGDAMIRYGYDSHITETTEGVYGFLGTAVVNAWNVVRGSNFGLLVYSDDQLPTFQSLVDYLPLPSPVNGVMYPDRVDDYPAPMSEVFQFLWWALGGAATPATPEDYNGPFGPPSGPEFQRRFWVEEAGATYVGELSQDGALSAPVGPYPTAFLDGSSDVHVTEPTGERYVARNSDVPVGRDVWFVVGFSHFWADYQDSLGSVYGSVNQAEGEALAAGISWRFEHRIDPAAPQEVNGLDDAALTVKLKGILNDAKECASGFVNQLNVPVTLEVGTPSDPGFVMETIRQDDGTSRIVVRTGIDSPAHPLNAGLFTGANADLSDEDKQARVDKWLEESFVHELGHVAVGRALYSEGGLGDLGINALCQCFLHRSSGVRGKAANFTTPPLWANKISEACAEVLKDHYLPASCRIYSNRTNWKLDSAKVDSFYSQLGLAK